jgi:uncharacterized membrane protein (UPF0127 family)
MSGRRLASRLDALPRDTIAGQEVPVAVGFRARLCGLAYLDREEAGAGLLIPSCSSVHTFGMRFRLDLVFLDAHGARLATYRRIPPRRFVSRRHADAVLEIPSPGG